MAMLKTKLRRALDENWRNWTKNDKILDKKRIF